jgi:F-type H+-transporting ATPase subunit delta
VSSNKSFSSETANRYALALYELAKENSEIEAVEKDIRELLAAYNNSEDLKNFIKNPTQSQSSQLEILNKICTQMNLSKIIKNFLSILVTKRRIFFLNTIILNFLSLISKKKGELRTSVTFNYKVDETLIGGLKLQIGSLMIDTSIKNKLKKYEQIMLEA